MSLHRACIPAISSCTPKAPVPIDSEPSDQNRCPGGRKSRALSATGRCEFESSNPSQAVRGSEKMPPTVAERPANSGLLQFGVPSLCSRFPGMTTEFGESLWLTPRIFPFLGDAGRRPGSIMHCVAEFAVEFAELSALATRILSEAPFPHQQRSDLRHRAQNVPRASQVHAQGMAGHLPHQTGQVLWHRGQERSRAPVARAARARRRYYPERRNVCGRTEY
jgi:hypothetical protein